jgi:hypothetical protein
MLEFRAEMAFLSELLHPSVVIFIGTFLFHLRLSPCVSCVSCVSCVCRVSCGAEMN